MTTVHLNQFVGLEVQTELASKTVITGGISHSVALMMITNPILSRIEYAVFFPGGSTVFTSDLRKAISEYNEMEQSK